MTHTTDKWTFRREEAGVILSLGLNRGPQSDGIWAVPCSRRTMGDFSSDVDFTHLNLKAKKSSMDLDQWKGSTQEGVSGHSSRICSIFLGIYFRRGSWLSAL